MSFVVHPYAWSSSSYLGRSSASAGSTIVTGLSAVFLDCNFSGGTVSTRTISAPTHLFCDVLFVVTVHAFVFLHVHSFDLALSQARTPGWQHLDLMYGLLIDHLVRV